MEFNQYCVTRRSMPFWCVVNPLSDPFGSFPALYLFSCSFFMSGLKLYYLN